MTRSPTLGWLHVIFDVPPEAAERSVEFWTAALGWPLGEPWPRHPEFRSFLPPDGAPYVHVQVGDHGPRIHVDARTENLVSETGRLRELGAGIGDATEDWQVMRSPAGMPFCLLHPAAALRPGAQRWPGGHRSRPVQVCIDIPGAHRDREVAFWQQAAGWRWRPSDSPQFAGKLFPSPDAPVQLLLQHIASDEDMTRAHLDVGTDDLDAEARRLVELGATEGDHGDGWIVMTDPTGLVFCVTANDPS